MSMSLSKNTRSLVVVIIVLLLAFMLVVPYGNKLMDRAASLMDPMRYKVFVTMAPAQNDSQQPAQSLSSVLIRKPPDVGENSGMVANVAIQKHPTTAGNFTPILILTYMRSGSSLTGEIMQQHPGAFYIYEPLRSLQTLYKSRSPLEYLNGTSVPFGKYNTTEIAVQTLRAWFTCDVKAVYRRGLMDKSFLSYGKKSEKLHDCLRASKTTTPLNYCATKLREACLKSKYRIVKTIRTSMRQIMDMMTELPQLKIIHLVRDPRDTMMSQKARTICGKGSPDELARCSARYCYRLSDDLAVSGTEDIFKERVLPVLYEDIAFRADEVCGEMYNFAGIELTEDIKKYVRRLTGNQSKEGCKVCQQSWQVGNSKKDATTHVEKWRTTMPATFRVIVDILCKDSIRYFNYSVLHPFWLNDW